MRVYKFLIVLALVNFFCATSLASNTTCTGFYQIKSKVFERVVYFEDPNLIPAKIAEELKGLSAQNTVKKLSEHLNALGVETQTQRVRHFLSKTDYHLVVVPNKNGAFLNQLAFKLKTNFGTNLLYRPFSESIGSYQKLSNSIFMSDFSALSGLADYTLMHEIRHAAMTVKENRGMVALANGYMRKMRKSQYPWRKTSSGVYESYMNMQEFSTYYQGRTYEMNEHFKRSQEKRTMNSDFLDATSPHASVFRELGDFLKYLLDNIDDKNSVRITQRGPTTVQIQTYSYFYSHYASLLVPHEFIGPNPSLKIEYARSYLKAFLKEVEQAQKREAAYSELKFLFVLSFKKFKEIPENQEILLSSRNVFAAMERIPELRENSNATSIRREQLLKKYISDSVVVVKEAKTLNQLGDFDSHGILRITLEDSYGTEVLYLPPKAILENLEHFENAGEIKKIEYIFPAEGPQKNSIEAFLIGLLN